MVKRMVRGNHKIGNSILIGYISISHFFLKNIIMNSTKFLLGGIVGGIVSFVLGYLFYGLLLLNYFNSNSVITVEMASINWLANIFSSLLYGFLFAYILSKTDISSVSSAIVFGLIAGLLLELSIDLGFYSVGQGYKNMTAILADAVLTAVIDAVIAAVIVWLKGMGKKAAA